MKLKSKIFTAVVILFILPVLLAVVSIYLISSYQNVRTQSQYGFNSGTVQTIANPIRMLDWLTSASYNNIKECIINEPASLENEETLEKINSEMNSTYAFLAVRKNDEFIYIGDKQKFERIDSSFPGYVENYGEEMQMVYLGGSFPCLVRQLNFVYSDGGKGTAFIVINVDKVIPQIKVLATEIIAVVLIVMIITCVVLISWIYKSVLRPINKLSKATQRISCGDLDFDICADKEDEIGTLFDDFENMRARLKELIEAQQAYEKESRELISNISHDLKTPLTAIKGYAEGILDGVADTKEKQQKYITTIYNKAIDMTSLVDELSLYSKLDSNMIPYDFQNIIVDDYFTDCMDELSVDAEINGLKLEYSNTCNKNTVVVIDGEQIKRVINNVVGNAVKYTGDKDGIIKVRISEKGKFVQVEIEDNGKGISKKDLKYIFDRFYRTDSSRNSAQGGTGLGLSIAKKIIDRHGGKIWAHSEENVGTTIYFTIRKHIEATNNKSKNKRKNYIIWSWYSGRKKNIQPDAVNTKESNKDEENKNRDNGKGQ